MFGKKAPVLTSTSCSEMENLRTAIEILTGERTTFIQIDFNTGKGKVRVGEVEKELLFIRSRSDLVRFNIGDGWSVGLFEEPSRAQVINEEHPHKLELSAGETITMRWIGSSATDRHEEPLFKMYLGRSKEELSGLFRKMIG